MYRIPKSTGKPVTLEIIPGLLKFIAKPLNSLIFEEARAYASQVINDIKKDFKDAQKTGAPTDHLPNITDPCTAMALSQFNIIKGLALAGVTGWEGVVEDDGKTPVKFSKDLLVQIIESDPTVMNTFYAQYTTDYAKMFQAKEESSPVQNGTSAGVQKNAQTTNRKAKTASTAKVDAAS